MKKIKNEQKKSAFTLIEILVSVTITGIIFSAVMVCFFVFFKMQEQTNVWRNLEKETHFTMMRIADKIRMHGVDYAQDNKIDQIFLKNNYVFEKKDENLYMNDEPLFSAQEILIKDVKFFISPEQDPNAGEKKFRVQPKVRMKISVQSKKIPDINFTLKTTISSRDYKF